MLWNLHFKLYFKRSNILNTFLFQVGNKMLVLQNEMSHDMRFATMWYVRPAKPQISLRIRVVWSEPLLVAWIFYECLATYWTSFGVSKLKIRLHRPVWVYTCQNATLLEITCHGSNVLYQCWKNKMLVWITIREYPNKLSDLGLH